MLLNHDGTAAQQPEPMTRRAARAAETSRREANPRKILTSGFATLRDLASYVLGAAIIVHEVWLTVHPDAYLVGVGVAFCGLPLVLGADEKRAK